MFNTGTKVTAFCFALQSMLYYHVQSCRKDGSDHPNCQLLPPDDQCGPVSHSPRVVGGKDATLGEFPWMALLYLSNSSDEKYLGPICGGSIITTRHVLTATHCVPAQPLKISHVRVGEHDLSSTTDCSPDGVCGADPKDVPVSRVVMHEEYDKNYHNDIALLYLESPLDFTLYISPICLPMSELFQSEGYHSKTTLQVAGWGVTDNNNKTMTAVLQTVSLPHVPLSECQDIYSEHDITDNQLCAGGVEGQDSCQGDSGGPLMVLYSFNQGQERYFQVGITSFGPSLCGSTPPSVYTNVAKYLQWILDKLDE